MQKSVTEEEIAEWAGDFAADRAARLVQNAVTQTPINKVAEDREIINAIDPSVSIKIPTGEATNQKKSGRCWMFASYNVVRGRVAKEIGVKNFQFSHVYLQFFDKFEKANTFLGNMDRLAERPADDREVVFWLREPIWDGGYWYFFEGLVRKYGAVPDYAMPETDSSSNTDAMNETLRVLMRRAARDIRAAASGSAREAIRAEALRQTYRVLAIHLGTPPREFIWQWEDDDHAFHREGLFTPRQFAEKYLGDLGDYVQIVDDPRHPRGVRYRVDGKQNIAGRDFVFVNVPVQTLKEVAIRELQAGRPVWMACDVKHQLDGKRGIWDANLYAYDSTYGIDTALTKAQMLELHEARLTHIMAFTGVDLVDAGAGDREVSAKDGVGTSSDGRMENAQTALRPRRWRIENSWGTDRGDAGFYTMNDSWFDQYVFGITVPRESVPREVAEAFAPEAPETVLPVWDPVGQ